MTKDHSKDITSVIGVHDPLEMLTMKNLSVDTNGILRYEKSTVLPELGFSFNGHEFKAYGQKEKDSWMIELIGLIAPMPFTSEDKEARSYLVDIAIATQQSPNCCFKLSNDNRHLVIYLAAHGVQDICIKNFLTELILMLLKIRPFMHLVEQKH